MRECVPGFTLPSKAVRERKTFASATALGCGPKMECRFGLLGTRELASTAELGLAG